MKKLLVSIALVVLCAGDAAANPPWFIYALRDVTGEVNQIYGFQIDPITEALTPLPGFPVGTGGTGIAAGVLSERLTYANGRLHVINDGTNTLSVFAVNRSTGALTALPFSPIALGVGSWACVAAQPGGSTVVVASAFGSVRSFVVTATTAAPSSLVSNIGAIPRSCAFSRDGSVVYTGGSSSFVAGFSVASGTGVLTPLPGSPFDSGANHGAAYATDSSGRLFISNSGGEGDARVFTTPAGVPTEVTDSPFTSGVSFGVHGVLHPAGYYMLADHIFHQVGVLRIAHSGAGTTLNPVSGSPFATGGTASSVLALANDGLTLVVANGDSRNLTILRVNANTGSLQFLTVQAANTLGATGRITGLASVSPPIVGDFNADRHADVFWHNKVTGRSSVWLMNGAAAIDSASFPRIAGNWEVKGIGDVDGNSKADVIWRNKVTGVNIVWLMNGLNIAASAVLPTIADTNWEIKGVADFDANGTADVIWRHRVTGDNIAWLMDGASVASFALLPTIADTNWTIVGAGDLDGDGKADVIWRHRVTGDNIAWLMNGASVTFSALLPPMAVPNWDVKGVGDLDTDTKADIVWRNKVTGQTIAWLMDGTTVVTPAVLAPLTTNWEIKSMRDLDGDGAADLVWRNKVTGQSLAWLMTGFFVKASAFLPTNADLNWEIVGQ